MSKPFMAEELAKLREISETATDGRIYNYWSA